jgi:hypothetical protein
MLYKVECFVVCRVLGLQKESFQHGVLEVKVSWWLSRDGYLVFITHVEIE